MYKLRTLFKNIYLVQGINHVQVQNCSTFSTNSINVNKVLVVSKLSRYEFEKKRHKWLDDRELERVLRNRGTDFDKLTHFHDLHKKFEENVVTTFRNMGIEVEVVNRFNCSDDKMNWADIVVPTGGDGTFLLAASRIKNNRKPVIGFNSDPNRSEGHLCLPKKYSTNIREAIEKLQAGNFEWLLRSRIRATLVCQKGELVPNYLHEITYDNVNNKTILPKSLNSDCNSNGKVLPCLALNEIFMGETLSARVSHLQMRLNGSTETTNLKCSGVCVSTGTGSTSWHLSINRLPVQSVAELLRLIDIDATESKDSLATVLSDIYNKNLIFKSDDKRMGYTIRDLISAGVWPQPKGIKSRGFATKIEVKSNCFDASLVVDGGVSFAFNDGTIAILEIKPEDALRTVILNEEE